MQIIEDTSFLESIIEDHIINFIVKNQNKLYVCIEDGTTSRLYVIDKEYHRKLLGKWEGMMYPEGIFNEKKSVIKVSDAQGVALLKLNSKTKLITGYYLDIRNIKRKGDNIIFEGLTHANGNYIWEKEELRY